MLAVKVFAVLAVTTPDELTYMVPVELAVTETDPALMASLFLPCLLCHWHS